MSTNGQNGTSNGTHLPIRNGVKDETMTDDKNGTNGVEAVNGRLETGNLEVKEISKEKDSETGSVGIRRQDEYEVDFSDTRTFAVFRWNDIVKTVWEKFTPEDQEMTASFNEWQDVAQEIQAKLADSSSSTTMKRQMGRVQPFPRHLSKLARIFAGLVAGREVKFDILWKLVYLTLKLSYASPDRLRRTTDLMYRVQRVVDLFNRCLEACDEANEARIAAVDFLDPIAMVFTDTILYFHECVTEKEAELAWPDLNDNINNQLWQLDTTVKHVNDITSYSKVNQDRRIKNMSLRHALMPETDEPGVFPNRILPFRQNPRFYGRRDELEKINRYLSPKDDQSLRTYTIYGRRGVGKTEIALHFAHTNHAGFDALFWIQCETSVAIRRSFTNVAVSLNLPGADRDGHHEENLLAVHEWLKKTRKRWLLIFDNAERDQILQGYWPIGASGAILITSRKYHNFSKDMVRQGDTIKPFSPAQSWDLLLQLLGDDWKKMHEEGRIPESEITAAKNLLDKLEGLALAIQQAAQLIKNPAIGGPTIAKTYEMFKEKSRTLPSRHSGLRSSSEQSLDALWDMIFNSLSENARTLLGVLAWLSSDVILVELFSPRNQTALDGALEFCKQDAVHIDERDRASLLSVITPSPAFETTIQELLNKELIKQDGRVLSIHRVVQEATSYHDVDDLQESFDIASRLVYEAFPRRSEGQSLYKQWSLCQEYIPHGVYLSKKFSDYTRAGVLKASRQFVKLLSNCAWYLHEIGDSDVCGRVIQTALAACDDKNSLIYAEILNTAGSRYNEKNRLSDARKMWELVLRIRSEKLPHDHVAMGGSYHNLGNLELASGNTNQCTKYYDVATRIWVKGGDAYADRLATTYLCEGRLHMLKGDLIEAMRLTSLAEAIFVRTIGPDKGFMSHVHYAYGNIHFLQRHWNLAWRAYDTCLKIGLAEMPIHPLTAAAYYSLACVEFELNHTDMAKAYLDKSKSIAELRSPTRDDGPIARILWKTAMVLESDTFGTYSAEAETLKTRAELAKQQLRAEGEGGLIPFIDEDDTGRNQEEDSFDALVPLYFR